MSGRSHASQHQHSMRVSSLEEEKLENHFTRTWTPTRQSFSNHSFIPYNYARRHKSLLLLGCALLVLVSFTSLLVLVFAGPLWSSATRFRGAAPVESGVNGSQCSHVQDTVAEVNTTERKSYVLGPPTKRFRDNLRSDTKYITSWYSAGWTNDVMTLGNLLYLATLTDRIPIIPPFIPSHVGAKAGTINVGEVFDLPRLSAALGIPLLEWHEVKQTNSGQKESVGCWSVWETSQPKESKPRFSPNPGFLDLDVSYTRAPDYVLYGAHTHAKFWPLASLGFPEERSRSLGTPRPSEGSGVVLHPDDHLLCYDWLYYVCAHEAYEYEHDFSPAWRTVLRHMKWTERLEKIANTHIRRSLGISETSDIPPFIAVHFRSGDFAWNHCPNHNREGCYADLSTFKRHVNEVQEELWTKQGIRVEEVIVTSDETDSAWWEEVASYGWTWVDYTQSRTVAVYGLWYPVLIDAFIQSRGVGFVGTDRSTMSLIAQRRTEDWQNGVTRNVLWGV